MPLVAFSNVAIDWSRVFAAAINPQSGNIPASVTLHVEGPGGEPIEIMLTDRDGVEAIERLKGEPDRFHALGLLYAEMSRVFRVWLSHDAGEAATITFSLPKSHNYMLNIPQGVARLLLAELRRANPHV